MLCIAMCNNINTDRPTDIRTLQFIALYTSCTQLHAHRQHAEQYGTAIALSVYHGSVPVPAGHAGGYSATSGAGRIAKFESGIYIHRYKELLLLACYVIASLECRLNTM